MHKNHHIKMLIASAAAGALLMISPASAAGLKNEIAAAAQHAGLAAQGADIATVHTHLHHTLNCLVGPKGSGFAPKEMNPCKELGNGAIPDATDAATKKSLKAAAKDTAAGIEESDFTKAQKTASNVETALNGLK